MVQRARDGSCKTSRRHSQSRVPVHVARAESQWRSNVGTQNALNRSQMPFPSFSVWLLVASALNLITMCSEVNGTTSIATHIFQIQILYRDVQGFELMTSWTPPEQLSKHHHPHLPRVSDGEPHSRLSVRLTTTYCIETKQKRKKGTGKKPLSRVVDKDRFLQFGNGGVY